MIALDIFQTGVAFVRFGKWFTESSQTITVTGQINVRLYYCCYYYYYYYYYYYNSSAS